MLFNLLLYEIVSLPIMMSFFENPDSPATFVRTFKSKLTKIRLAVFEIKCGRTGGQTDEYLIPDMSSAYARLAKRGQ
jgi:hypothetical protein